MLFDNSNWTGQDGPFSRKMSSTLKTLGPPQGFEKCRSHLYGEQAGNSGWYSIFPELVSAHHITPFHDIS